MTAAKTLIGCVISFPVLALPDVHRHFSLITDVSDAPVGVMPSQQADNSKTHQTIVGYSHRFMPMEQRCLLRERGLHGM